MANVPFRFAGVSAALLLLAAISAHGERKVYKCTDANGVVVFSERACGQDAKEMNVDPGRAEPPAAAAMVQPNGTTTPLGPSKKRGTPDSLRDISDDVDDANCRREAERLAVVGNDGHLDDLVRKRDSVANDVASVNGNSAWGQRQIAIMEVAIEQERSRISLREMQAQAASRAALAKCDAAKAAREKNRM